MASRKTHRSLKSLSSIQLTKRFNSSTFQPHPDAGITHNAFPTPPRLRFAPSPTGELHVGGLRTALVNYLVARKYGGKWILRIEDTDRTRLVDGSIDNLRENLEWAGLEYDEGIGAGGEYGSYIQSERLDLYQDHAKKLIEQDKAYECFCTMDELEAIRKSMQKSGQRGNYDGRCRHHTREEVKRLKESGKKYTIRYKHSHHVPAMPRDLVFGQINYHSDVGIGNFDDFVLQKGDGFPTYHLASVVDDHYMKISHVVRGEEWLNSLGKHIDLYTAFGWTPPTFAHLPLMVDSRGLKLSKRREPAPGEVGALVETYRDRGYEPEALINFLGILGWDPKAHLLSLMSGHLPVHRRNDNNSLYEIFTLPQLVQAFDITRLNRHKVQLDMNKLTFLNKQTLRRKAGRLGAEQALVDLGKTSDSEADKVQARKDQEKEYFTLLRKFTRDLLALPELKGSPLLEDTRYIAKVFNLELPRAKIFKEMAPDALYLFLPPDYQTKEATDYFESARPQHYLNNITFVRDLVEEVAEQSDEFEHEKTYGIISYSKDNCPGFGHKHDLFRQVRHALTGRQRGIEVPVIMDLLGPKETLRRLNGAIAWHKEKYGDIPVDDTPTRGTNPGPTNPGPPPGGPIIRGPSVATGDSDLASGTKSREARKSWDQR